MSEVRLKKNGEPAKNRGRKPGTPKTGGRKAAPPPVRVEMSPTETRQFFLPKWAQHLDDILAGKEIEFAHKLGKRIKRIRTPEEYMFALKELGTKLMPTLQASAVKAEVDTSAPIPGNVSNRDVARSILSILENAKLEDELHPRPQPPPIPQPQLLLGRDDVIEVSAGQPETAPSAPVGLHGDERKDNRAVMPSSGPKVVRRMPRRIR